MPDNAGFNRQLNRQQEALVHALLAVGAFQYSIAIAAVMNARAERHLRHPDVGPVQGRNPLGLHPFRGAEPLANKIVDIP
jgi:hypothetical protein